MYCCQRIQKCTIFSYIYNFYLWPTAQIKIVTKSTNWHLTEYMVRRLAVYVSTHIPFCYSTDRSNTVFYGLYSITKYLIMIGCNVTLCSNLMNDLAPIKTSLKVLLIFEEKSAHCAPEISLKTCHSIHSCETWHVYLMLFISFRGRLEHMSRKRLIAQKAICAHFIVLSPRSIVNGFLSWAHCPPDTSLHYTSCCRATRDN